MQRDGDNWRYFADEDLRMAELAFADKLYTQVCFHSQQACEKMLKSLLADKAEPVPKTHKLSDLLPMLPDIPAQKIQEDVILLDRFYIPTRYPDALPGSIPDGLPTEQEAKEALDTARKLAATI